MSNQKILLDSAGSRHFLLGNEAIARGAIEAGIHIATTYPGTPASEITDTLSEVARDVGIFVEYSTNEKVAVEVAAGASISGARSIVSMKHVGFNVASDAAVTLAYVGVKGGCVIVSADDPHCWSSQNEQDNRYYALLSKIPCLEPSNPQEAKDMVLHAFEISEKLELPIMLRLVTRVSHVRGIVTFGPLSAKKTANFERDPRRFVMVPENARIRHRVLLDKIVDAEKISEDSPFTFTVGEGKLGIITSGVSFNYSVDAVRELNLDASILKIGMVYPLPGKIIKNFLAEHNPIILIEELEPYLELQVRALSNKSDGPLIYGKSGGKIPQHGELSVGAVVKALSEISGLPRTDSAFNLEKVLNAEKVAPKRPPTLCAGCPHMASFYLIKTATKGQAVYATDIGCYALGFLPPLSIGDVLLCMGASVGLACGISQVVDKPVIGIVGDSTFFHASIPGLIDAVYNNHKIVYVVLDNETTAMTNFQPHPGTGVTGMGTPTKKILIEDIARACGVKFVKVIDPFDIKNSMSVLKEAIRFLGPSLIISRRICTALDLQRKRKIGEKNIPCRIEREKCNDCMACVKLLGCPGLIVKDGKVDIDETLCVGCGVCLQICPLKAIIKES